jgi:hypothetical protein
MNRFGSGKVLFATVCGLFLSAAWAVARPAQIPSAPSLGCAGATGLSIALEVCAGPAGAPGGFSIQRTSVESFVAGPDGHFGTADDNGWPEGNEAGICTASFVGRAQFSPRELRPNQCVTVDVGQLLADSGASTNCSGSLQCGATYVFRALARGAAAHAGIPVSPNLFCSTLRCSPAVSGCTVTAAYWKDHGPLPPRGNVNEWGVSSLALGNVVYSDLDLQAILETPADGNGLIALAQQLIAAKLNVANGTDDTDAASAILAADKMIGGLVVPPRGSGDLAIDATWEITEILTGYNEGAIGPGHCD